ncbi:hypothetical protein EDE11_10726 [Methylomonas methanica]|uniref:SOS response associated peptidase (SRAP) n=1 Tax=Methylomonas methanica TaxID=421 RepID=A0ABY2CR18_METMH|nr:hypothetical protein EDE11_10726 [Methylomonas methanica]
MALCGRYLPQRAENEPRWIAVNFNIPNEG